jgi:thioredoxin reductase (NADPH)
MDEGKNFTSMEESSTPELVLLAVDDDPNALGRIEHELRQRYGSYYRVACEDSPEVGMRTMRELMAAGEDVAVVLADQWMPGMTGVEFLTHTRQLYPVAKRALLFERGNRTTREPILQGIISGSYHQRLEISAEISSSSLLK